MSLKQLPRPFARLNRFPSATQQHQHPHPHCPQIYQQSIPYPSFVRSKPQFIATLICQEAKALRVIMSRQRSPAPPHLPPKDSSSSLSSTHSASRPTSRHINIDLAEAVRDSVQIGGKSAQASPNLDFSSTSRFRQSPNLPQQPSLNPLVPRRTPSPNPPQNQNSALRADNHNITANRMSYLQPELPSQRVISSQNPFESDEIEPPPGPIRQPVRSASGDALNGGRGKLTRAQTR